MEIIELKTRMTEIVLCPPLAALITMSLEGHSGRRETMGSSQETRR